MQREHPLSAATNEGSGVAWFDDYYTIQWIDSDTIAIGEPRYHQQNYSYLIRGKSRAVLFDSGPGVRDITPVVAGLTSLPVIAVASHLHFDHIGNHHRFQSLALADLPYIRNRAANGLFRPAASEHLGFVEGIAAPLLRVTEWWAPNSTIDLGDRRLLVIHTPGHTNDSIALLDVERGQLFTGDYIYPGPLFAFLPGSRLDAYLETAKRLLGFVNERAVLLTAHRADPPGAPTLHYRDLEDLRDTLHEIKEGTLSGRGFLPRVFRINDRLSIYTDFPWTERWEK